jgi:cupin fold WbuC family metalloprotein
MIKTYSSDRLDALKDTAASATRARAHLNVHEELDANVQRLFIATQPDTYMRPHRHREAHKWEFFIVLQGRIDLLVFDELGELQQRVALSAEQTRAVEVPPRTWHAYVCMAADTLAMEIKEGEYLPTEEQDFASWSPAENTAQAPAFLAQMRVAQTGDSVTIA